jgi:hypothetical protein
MSGLVGKVAALGVLAAIAAAIAAQLPELRRYMKIRQM